MSLLFAFIGIYTMLNDACLIFLIFSETTFSGSRGAQLFLHAMLIFPDATFLNDCIDDDLGKHG